MKTTKAIKSHLTLFLSAAILVWSFLLPFAPVKISEGTGQNKAFVDQLSFVDFFGLPTVYEEGHAFKNILNDGLFAGIKNQEFTWANGPLLSNKNLSPYAWVSYHYFKQILFPFHSFW
ncbi:hypothetical protein [Cyclobacterium marinum]|uniref:Uncharacterized protein n=1 Tax=Cyclobacterium marinum (strain ATCC 25205 / DSM 745 / LMG 13164 / NCIMB 1802) TaxID=880070 RepID=G0IYR1_CYCMS|nr:hypothetical protein [Cyclobacterium marinum]AEL27244.1 hypothetical protein Cycma_3524 [Cyclobacterium marinum DSM 745]MBI0400492.1 hypothetical protein [Cyclobacterium marinum]MBR9775177.1 hypothetical protein [Cytophagales bacterium]|tara:strand:+ start:37606 stop:37959 length:354 start_codon:yes stop_codon:yes gene_type:complete